MVRGKEMAKASPDSSGQERAPVPQAQGPQGVVAAPLLPQRASGAAQFFQVLKMIRAPLVVALFAFIILVVPGQTHELYRNLAYLLEDVLLDQGKRRVWLNLAQIAAPFLSLALMAFILWYVTRYLVFLLERTAARITGFNRRLLALSGGLIGALPASGAALGFVLSHPDVPQPVHLAIFVLYLAFMTILVMLFITGGRLRQSYRRLRSPHKTGDAPRPSRPHGLSFTGLLLLFLVLLLIIGTVVAFTLTRLQWHGIGAVLSMTIAFLLIWAAHHRLRHASSGARNTMPKVLRFAPYALFLIIVTVSITLLSLYPVTLPQFVGAISIFSLFIALLAFVLAHVTYLADKSGVPIVSLTLLYVATLSLFSLNDNHAIREVGGKPITRAVPVDRLDAPDVEAKFTEWFASRADRHRFVGKTYPVYVIAAQGGGIYAAYHSAMFLSRLQDLCDNFAQHVFAISSVSGGSLGAATFAGLTRAARNTSTGRCKPRDPSWDFERPAAHQKRVVLGADGQPQLDAEGRIVPPRKSYQILSHRILSNDFISPLAFSTLFPDFLARFLPYPFHQLDRSKALEAAFEVAWEKGLADLGPNDTPWKALGNPFAESFLDRRNWATDNAVPALLINTTGVTTGIPWIISPFDLDNRVSRRNFPLWKQRRDDDADSHPLPTQAGVVQAKNPSTASPEETPPNIPLSQAVSLSARFPWLTAPGSIPVRDELGRVGTLRLADGAYFENSGVNTALELIGLLKSFQPTLEKTFQQRISINLLVLTATGTVAKIQAAAGFSEALAPIRALMNTTSARSRIMIDRADRELDANRNDCARDPSRDPRVCVKRARQVRLNIGTIPLGWHLSEDSRAKIWRQLGNHHRCEPDHLYRSENLQDNADCVQRSIMHELDATIEDELARLTERNRELIRQTAKVLADAKVRLAELKAHRLVPRTPPEGVKASFDREAFYACISPKLHKGRPILSIQREGYEALLDYWEQMDSFKMDKRRLAYALAVAYHSKRMVTYLPPKDSKRWPKDPLTGHRYYPRGYLQLRSPRHYRDVGRRAGLGDALYREPDLLLDPDISARLLFEALQRGISRSGQDAPPLTKILRGRTLAEIKRDWARAQMVAKTVESTSQTTTLTVDYRGADQWWDAGASLALGPTRRAYIAQAASAYLACLVPDMAKGHPLIQNVLVSRKRGSPWSFLTQITRLTERVTNSTISRP